MISILAKKVVDYYFMYQKSMNLLLMTGRVTMQAAKQDALNTINQLPDNADMEEIMYRLYVLDKVRKGQEAVERGETLTSEAMQREIDQW